MNFIYARAYLDRDRMQVLWVYEGLRYSIEFLNMLDWFGLKGFKGDDPNIEDSTCKNGCPNNGICGAWWELLNVEWEKLLSPVDAKRIISPVEMSGRQLGIIRSTICHTAPSRHWLNILVDVVNRSLLRPIKLAVIVCIEKAWSAAIWL